ncbi:hypothetical protein RSOLAG1IB_02150 [Rhizoctonia solani AG-1 IB]|uniref:Uncharacterized protein n=1 Tax=Thanatephorus cucumeris (strain AG1-IB / isolate 7/3/14) TaxID=1108050 RepID=A0A0B7FHD5_THACB|nr:hypothetical protein RSOLAG1IB_02150 [Rhizoctonia solani AG-1 IB]
MSTHSHHTYTSRRSHSSSRPAQYVTAAPASNYSYRTTQTPVQYISTSGSTRSHRSGHSHHRHNRNGSTQYVYAQPSRSVRSSSSVGTARDRPRYERAKSSGVTMTVIPATPRRPSHGSVVSYRPEHDERGKLKLSTRIRRLFGLGPKREEIAAERGRTQYIYPASSSGRRSTSRVAYSS